MFKIRICDGFEPCTKHFEMRFQLLKYRQTSSIGNVNSDAVTFSDIKIFCYPGVYLLNDRNATHFIGCMSTISRSCAILYLHNYCMSVMTIMKDDGLTIVVVIYLFHYFGISYVNH